jgi:outer membrane receptor protein involved in Fe transport
MKFFLLCCFIITTTVTANATDIFKGRITDAATKEPLQGASIKLLDSKGKTISTIVSGLDGTFTFRNIQNAAGYQIEITYSGYKTISQPLTTGSEITDFALVSATQKMDEVVVVSKTDKSSDAATLSVERKADNIMNVVSGRTIEVSPDLSVANVTQRVAGVSLQRSSNGEGQYAIVRGMDKRYNYTLVNSIKIPSPDNKNRYVPLDIFPAELLDRLEVTKALTPNMEGDAIGGVVNLVMKEAPAGFSLKANAGLSYAQSFIDGNKFTTFDHAASNARSPRDRNGESYLATMADFPNNASKFSTKSALAFNGGISIGGRVMKNKLGLLLAASSQNNFRDVKALYFGTETNPDNDPKLDAVQRRNYSIRQQRSGLHGFADYNINARNKLKLYAAYLDLNQSEYRFASDTNLVLGRTGLGTGRITNTYRTTTQVQRIYNVTLKGEHTIAKDFLLAWAAVYSKATGNQPGRASLVTTTGVNMNNGTLEQQKVYLDNSSFRDWSRNSDEDKSGYLNFTYKSVIAKAKVDWTIGGMYRDKERNSLYDNYNIRPATSPQEYNGNIDNNTFVVFNPQGSSTDPLNYQAFEKVGAFYGMAKAEKGKLQIVAGARVEFTNFDWTTSAPKTVEGSFGNIKYNDVLPSVHVKYKLADKQFLRASYYSAISRPGFYELIPHTYVDPGSDYPEQGNPYLKRTTAENFDLRYEYFPKGLDQLLASVFYKNIKNPIEYAIVQRGAGNTYYSPNNFGTGSNYGFEFDATKYFHSFGIKANYTFTKSQITTTKVRRYQTVDVNGQPTQTQDYPEQKRPLQGQSKNVANVSLLYKNGKKGIDAQLAVVYTGDRINTVSPFLNNDIWQKGFVQMDISAVVRIIKNFFVFAKANNILNTAYQLELHQDYKEQLYVPFQEAGKNVFVRKDTYGANYLLGFRFKL